MRILMRISMCVNLERLLTFSLNFVDSGSPSSSSKMNPRCTRSTWRPSTASRPSAWRTTAVYQSAWPTHIWAASTSSSARARAACRPRPSCSSTAWLTRWSVQTLTSRGSLSCRLTADTSWRLTRRAQSWSYRRFHSRGSWVWTKIWTSPSLSLIWLSSHPSLSPTSTWS